MSDVDMLVPWLIIIICFITIGAGFWIAHLKYTINFKNLHLDILIDKDADQYYQIDQLEQKLLECEFIYCVDEKVGKLYIHKEDPMCRNLVLYRCNDSYTARYVSDDIIKDMLKTDDVEYQTSIGD